MGYGSRSLYVLRDHHFLPGDSPGNNLLIASLVGRCGEDMKHLTLAEDLAVES